MPSTVGCMVDEGAVVWYNPQCSKCIGADELLAAHGVPAHHVHYLDDPPARSEILRKLGLLGARPPELLVRLLERGAIG